MVLQGNQARAPSNTRNTADLANLQVEILQKVFEIASDKCQYDHPLCLSCTNTINGELARNLKEECTERDTFRAFANDLNVDDSDSAATTSDNVKISLEEKELRDQLSRIRGERKNVKEELQTLETEEKKLNTLYQRFWRDFQDIEHGMQLTQNDTYSLNRKIKHATKLLDDLRRTNVLNDAFHISHDGHFGTINGFRLGRLESVSVDSAETNAGLGQIVLLLDVIAKQVTHIWAKYRLLPCGSFSKMSKLTDPGTQLELYGNNDRSLARLFWYNHFDTALCWLLECVDELSRYAQSVDANFNPPHEIKISNSTIGGISVKLQLSSQSHQYTKALKLLLTRCKYLIMWTTRQSGKSHFSALPRNQP